MLKMFDVFCYFFVGFPKATFTNKIRFIGVEKISQIKLVLKTSINCGQK